MAERLAIFSEWAAAHSLFLCLCFGTAVSAIWLVMFCKRLSLPRSVILPLAIVHTLAGLVCVKLFAAAGLALGFRGTLWVLVLSAVGSAVIFSVLLLMRKIKKEDMVQLGPYICGAGIFYVVIVWPLLVKM